MEESGKFTLVFNKRAMVKESFEVDESKEDFQHFEAISDPESEYEEEEFTFKKRGKKLKSKDGGTVARAKKQVVKEVEFPTSKPLPRFELKRGREKFTTGKEDVRVPIEPPRTKIVLDRVKTEIKSEEAPEVIDLTLATTELSLLPALYKIGNKTISSVEEMMAARNSRDLIRRTLENSTLRTAFPIPHKIDLEAKDDIPPSDVISGLRQDILDSALFKNYPPTMLEIYGWNPTASRNFEVEVVRKEERLTSYKADRMLTGEIKVKPEHTLARYPLRQAVLGPDHAFFGAFIVAANAAVRADPDHKQELLDRYKALHNELTEYATTNWIGYPNYVGQLFRISRNLRYAVAYSAADSRGLHPKILESKLQGNPKYLVPYFARNGNMCAFMMSRWKPYNGYRMVGNLLDLVGDHNPTSFGDFVRKHYGGELKEPYNTGGGPNATAEVGPAFPGLKQEDMMVSSVTIAMGMAEAFMVALTSAKASRAGQSKFKSSKNQYAFNEADVASAITYLFAEFGSVLGLCGVKGKWEVQSGDKRDTGGRSYYPKTRAANIIASIFYAFINTSAAGFDSTAAVDLLHWHASGGGAMRLHDKLKNKFAECAGVRTPDATYKRLGYYAYSDNLYLMSPIDLVPGEQKGGDAFLSNVGFMKTKRVSRTPPVNLVAADWIHHSFDSTAHEGNHKPEDIVGCFIMSCGAFTPGPVSAQQTLVMEYENGFGGREFKDPGEMDSYFDGEMDKLNTVSAIVIRRDKRSFVLSSNAPLILEKYMEPRYYFWMLHVMPQVAIQGIGIVGSLQFKINFEMSGVDNTFFMNHFVTLHRTGWLSFALFHEDVSFADRGTTQEVFAASHILMSEESVVGSASRGALATLAARDSVELEFDVLGHSFFNVGPTTYALLARSRRYKNVCFTHTKVPEGLKELTEGEGGGDVKVAIINLLQVARMISLILVGCAVDPILMSVMKASCEFLLHSARMESLGEDVLVNILTALGSSEESLPIPEIAKYITEAYLEEKFPSIDTFLEIYGPKDYLEYPPVTEVAGSAALESWLPVTVKMEMVKKSVVAIKPPVRRSATASDTQKVVDELKNLRSKPSVAVAVSGAQLRHISSPLGPTKMTQLAGLAKAGLVKIISQNTTLKAGVVAAALRAMKKQLNISVYVRGLPATTSQEIMAAANKGVRL